VPTERDARVSPAGADKPEAQGRQVFENLARSSVRHARNSRSRPPTWQHCLST